MQVFEKKAGRTILRGFFFIAVYYSFKSLKSILFYAFFACFGRTDAEIQSNFYDGKYYTYAGI